MQLSLFCSCLSSQQGLRTPNKAFFHRNPKFLGLDTDNEFWGIWGIISQTSAPILLQWVPCPCFPFFNIQLNPFSNKKDKHPERFFFRKPQTFGLGQTNDWKILGHFGYFRLIYQQPFWYCGFFINQPLFLQKTMPLYPNPLKKYLGVGAEFEPERIRNLVIMCP